MYQIYLFSLLLFSLIAPIDGISNSPFIGDEKATISFDLDECYSRIHGQSRFDFSEFTASTVNSSFAEVAVLGDNLYRNSPEQNGHSCTPGIAGTPAMCVTSSSSCNYESTSDKAIVIDISVQPIGNEPVTLSKFSFYELAPQQFSYIDGASGINDYPTLYGIRVLKNGVEIFKKEAISTTAAWSLEEFEFSSIEGFTITERSEFSFMLLGYCSVGNAANVNVWDVEQIEIEVSQESTVSGGSIIGGPFEFCIDGEADNVRGITVIGNSGTKSQWIVTDPEGNILGLPPTPEAVDFDGAGAGVCFIWHLSYSDGLTGLTAGNNVSELVGCYDLSNSVQVTRTSVEGGEISGDPFEFCVDGVSDNVSGVEVIGNSGANSQWIVTDPEGNILGLPPTPEAVDFDGAGAGVCFIWHLSYSDGLTGLTAGSNVSELVGCYDLSNSVQVTRTVDGSACTQGVGVPIINEVLGSGMVEIRNIGDGSVDISDYWLCDRPEYDRIGNLQINCGGDFILEPGELITVVLSSITVDGADGEMGLYINSSFGSTSAIIDYVEWGSTGHGRSSIAVDANIWISGDAAISFANDQSLAFDGTGDSSSDWSATASSPCDQNGFAGFIDEWNLVSNPVSDIAKLSVVSLTDQNKVTIEIWSLQGDLIKVLSQPARKGDNTISINTSDLRNGLYLIVMRSPSIKRIEKLVKQ